MAFDKGKPVFGATREALQGIGELLKTAATLAIGSPQVKAQRLAGLAKHYNIDIGLLDQALAGTMPENPEEDRLQRLLDQRMGPVNQLMQQVQQAQQNQQQQVFVQANQTVEQFGQDPRNEHYDAVRTVMADFLDVAAHNGQVMTLDEAYQRACMATPGVAEEMTRRFNSGVVSTQQQHLQQKSNAAASISGQRSSGGSGTPNYDKMSMREMLEAQLPQQARI